MRYSAVIDARRLDADAVFELHGSPCIYFTSINAQEPTAAELLRLHKVAWNHGLAPMLWVVTPTTVQLYNCFSRPTSNEEAESARHLVETFERSIAGIRELNDFAGRLQIETGAVWQHGNARRIDRRERVDASLLNDLMQAEERLRHSHLPAHIAHALLSRSIFVAYLFDRGILKREFLNERFGRDSVVDVLESHETAYELFEWVEETFNGDLFPLRSRDGQARERDLVDHTHVALVRDFLRGMDYQHDQYRLWPYEFDIIPVELISSIYERFSHAADAAGARARSTHYTPLNLVDLVLTNVFDKPRSRAKVLDMACGSGVFLVESLRRLVGQRIVEGEDLTRELVRETLYGQVFGIDVNPGAVQIAAFSLYLTALELDPNPSPPEALRFAPLIDRNLFVADAFDESASFNSLEPFASRGFDLVVGNPPWTRSAHSRSGDQYCVRRGYALARQSQDQAFLWRAGDFARDEAVIGLVLASKPFFATTPQARRARSDLMRRFAPLAMLNLGELRQRGLFSTASAPAMVLVAHGREMAAGDDVAYVRIDYSGDFSRHGIIEIAPENVRMLPVIRAARDLHLLKVATWGGVRDFALIRRLRTGFPTLARLGASRNWQMGQGFQSASGADLVPPAIRELPWLLPRTITRYQLRDETLASSPPERMHRIRKIEIYRAPVVVATRGIGRRGFAAAFSAIDVVYNEGFFGIAVPRAQANEAHYLNALLNSSLVTYFLFLTSAVWGVERDEVRPQDIKRIPIPPLDVVQQTHPSEVAELLRIEGDLRELALAGDSESSRFSELQQQLDRIVYQVYGLASTEVILIEDMISTTLSLRREGPHSAALQPPNGSELQQYAAQWTSTIESLLTTLGERRAVGEVYDTGDAPLQVVQFSLVENHSTELGRHLSEREDGAHDPPEAEIGSAGVTIVLRRRAPGALERLLGEIADLLPLQLAPEVFARRSLRVYGPNAVFLVKPSQQRYWTRTAALYDADAVLAEDIQRLS